MDSLPTRPLARRMDMGGMADMDDMNTGITSVYHYPNVYWSFIGAVIAAFTLVNLYNHLLLRQR